MDVRYVNVFGVKIWLDSFVMLLVWLAIGAGVVGAAWISEFKSRK